MDARWLKILIERGRIHPEVKALKRRLRARRGRVKYSRPQDLLILPRNPAEAKARGDLSLVTETIARMKVLREATAALIAKRQIEMQLKKARQVYEEYQRQKAIESALPFYWWG